MAQYTITHSEKTGGWTSFWSFIPDWMTRLNNRFYSIKNGQLYLHNDETAVRNNFYGTQYSSNIKTVLNDAMQDDKIFKTLVLEADEKWAASIATNYTESTITANEFNTRESRQFSFIRKNEDTDDLRGHAAQGIGAIASALGLTITFTRIPNLVDVGNQLYQIDGAEQQLIGTITDINNTTNIITVNAITTAPAVGFYAYAKKNSRIEGSEVRGIYAEVTLTNTGTAESELMAVSSNAVKSFV